jgi:hypothetical protein
MRVTLTATVRNPTISQARRDEARVQLAELDRFIEQRAWNRMRILAEKTEETEINR